MADLVPSLDRAFRDLDPLARLRALRASVDGRIVLTTSFGLEDQYLTYLVFDNDLAIDVVTLDTGRLFPQTYTVWAETEARYNRRIRPYYPDATALEELVARQGIDGFYDSVEARKACCGLRKVEPLKRALSGASAWVTGLRADASQARADAVFVARDETHAVLKANPLLDWSRDRVERAAHESGVPVNALHAQGFPSIGCAPCTRAVKPGEDERAGRWWWEQDGKKECGLHVTADGTIVPHAPSSDGERPWSV
ncbi:MAG: phosphoadenylyl-sulfate reductase [Hyphomicrobiales bacterium]|nr:phosphoadenylyl-sulfate reductase [Hyphomicrobiales bacterium]